MTKVHVLVLFLDVENKQFIISRQIQPWNQIEIEDFCWCIGCRNLNKFSIGWQCKATSSLMLCLLIWKCCWHLLTPTATLRNFNLDSGNFQIRVMNTEAWFWLKKTEWYIFSSQSSESHFSLTFKLIWRWLRRLNYFYIKSSWKNVRLKNAQNLKTCQKSTPEAKDRQIIYILYTKS